MGQEKNTSEQSATRTIAVVEDDAAVLQVITAFLRSTGVRTRGFPSAEAFLDALDWSPELDCVISDVRLGKIDGIELIERLRSAGMSVPVVLITGHGDVALAVRAMKAGAQDFIEKPFEPEHLASAAETAIRRSKSIGSRFSEVVQARASLDRLTDRQKEVVDLIAAGLTSKEIGCELRMSYRTVETHRFNLMEKLGISSLAELIRLKVLAEAGDE